MVGRLDGGVPIIRTGLNRGFGVGRLGEGCCYLPFLQVGVVLEHGEGGVRVPGVGGDVEAAVGERRDPVAADSAVPDHPSLGELLGGESLDREPEQSGSTHIFDCRSRATRKGRGESKRTATSARVVLDSYPIGVYSVTMTEQHGYTPQKDALTRRMKRIEGQVRGIGKMIDDDKYCIDILTQVSAATAALHAVSINLLEEHIAHCVVDAAGSGDEEEARKKVEEASAAISRLIKS